MVWLLIGKYNKNNNQYNAKALHYVCVTGYGINADYSFSPEALTVHCSSPVSGLSLKNENLSINTMKNGMLNINILGENLKKNAKGFYEITKGLAWKKNSHVIINGAVIIEI